MAWWPLQGRGGGGGGDYGRREEKSKRQLRVARLLQSTIADVIRRYVRGGKVLLGLWIVGGWMGGYARGLVG